MSTRRPLGEMVSEIAAGTLDAFAAAGSLVAPREVRVSLPVEVALGRTGEGLSVLAELPRTVTRTAFDVRPGRLELVWRAEARS
jgi:hypothetical protein